MDDLFLPWWSLLLLGTWAIALTLWMHPTVHRELRFWSGLFTLFYLGLIFLALGSGARTTIVESASSSPIRLYDLVVTFTTSISLTACVWLMGPISSWCRSSCYVVFTLANATLCAILKQPEIGFGLLFIAGWTARPLLRDWSRDGFRLRREQLAEFLRFNQFIARADCPSEFWRIGVLTGALAISLLGTISHSLRVETTLPTSDQIDRVLVQQNQPPREMTLVDLALGRRADLVVLLAIVVFLCLAVSMIDQPKHSPAQSAAASSPSASPSSGESL